jgi:hypothetical protein
MGSQNSRVYEFTIASGATASTAVTVYGGFERVFLLLSSVTGFNSAAGNTRLYLQGKHPNASTWINYPGASSLTEIGCAIAYDWGVVPPFSEIRVACGSACSSVAVVYLGLQDR